MTDRTFRVIETAAYEVLAATAEDAERIYLDWTGQGDSRVAFIGVTDREIAESDRGV